MYDAFIGWGGFFVGWLLTLLYMKGKLWQFPFYDRIINQIYKTPEKPVTDPLKATEEFLSNLREAIVNQILNHQPQLFDAIAKQRIILANQQRAPVAIFLNVTTFKGLLSNALSNDQLNEVESLYEAIQGLDMPVGHLGDLPIYVTELLVAAPVFVAGGISWKI